MTTTQEIEEAALRTVEDHIPYYSEAERVLFVKALLRFAAQLHAGPLKGVKEHLEWAARVSPPQSGLRVGCSAALSALSELEKIGGAK